MLFTTFYSIDNLRMRGCFELNNQITAVNGKCHTSDVKCTSNKVEVCIKSRQQCDINIDCDNKEDEMVNCGKCHSRSLFLLLFRCPVRCICCVWLGNCSDSILNIWIWCYRLQNGTIYFRHAQKHAKKHEYLRCCLHYFELQHRFLLWNIEN